MFTYKAIHGYMDLKIFTTLYKDYSKWSLYSKYITIL